MTAPIERGRYWVFDEQQLEAAIEEYASDMTDDAEAENSLRVDLIGFMNSRAVVSRGMRRGGED